MSIEPVKVESLLDSMNAWKSRDLSKAHLSETSIDIDQWSMVINEVTTPSAPKNQAQPPLLAEVRVASPIFQ
jgi:hypothetical protein